MIGYGPESNHFVIELTYNYGVTNYNLGKIFLACIISGKFVAFLSENFHAPVSVIAF